jgi:AraC-like DNA-binding protein
MKVPTIDFDHNKTEQAEFELIELTSLYQNTFNHSNPAKPHKIKFFTLIYIEKGEGTHMIDFVNHPYSSGSFIFVQREQVHAFDFDNKPQGKALLFTQEFLDQVHANMRLPNYTPTHLNRFHNPIIILDEKDNQRCQNIINEISTEISHVQSNSLIVMYLFSALSLLLHRISPKLQHDKLSQEQSRKFSRFIELLFVHYKKTRDANWYANQINTTYKTLNQVCKLATDLTAKQLVDSYTIIEIKRLLLVSNVTTQQIANAHGFEDASNFVKYFKNHTQLTPSQFQKRFLIPTL